MNFFDNDILSAIRKNGVGELDKLTKFSDQFNNTDGDGKNLIHHAAESGSLEVIEFLEKKGLKIEDKNKKTGENILHIASRAGEQNVLNYGIEKNRALINSENNEGKTALFYAVDKENDDISQSLIESLIKNGAEATESMLEVAENKENKNTRIIKLLANNLLFCAVQQGKQCVGTTDRKTKITNYITYGANINYQDNKGRTVLHYASEKGDLDLIKFLEEKGAIAVKDKDGNNPIHLVTAINTLKYFIEKGVDINDPGQDNKTPLHCAAEKGLINIAEFLLKQKNIDIYARNKKQETPLDLAEKHKEVKTLLLSRLLIDAIKNNNKEHFNRYLEKNPDLSYSYEENQWTPLHYAANGNNRLFVEKLVQKKADVNAFDKDGNKPIHIAAQGKKFEIVKFFLDLKEESLSINDKNANGDTVLHYAAKSDDVESIKFLLEQDKVDIDVKDSDGKTPLDFAEKHQEVKKLLLSKLLIDAIKKNKNFNKYLEKNPDLSYSYEENQWTPLHYAVDSNNRLFVEKLVEKKADIHALDKDGNKPIHIAARKGYKNMVEFFLDKGININDVGDSRKTLLHYAVENNYVDLFEFLINKEGIELNGYDQSQRTPLHYAVAISNKEFVEGLIKKNANVNAKNKESKTALDLAKNNKEIEETILGKILIDAVKENNIDKVKEYIDQKANVNYWYEDNKWTALHYAASLGYKRSAEELFKNNSIDISAKDSNGNEAINIAAANGHKNIVELLLEKGVNISNINANGKTALQIAKERNHQEIVKLLLSKLLLNAVQKGSLNDIKECLNDRSAEIINNLDRHGWTPLHHAVNGIQDSQEVVKLLIMEGAKFNVTNNEGDKPIHIASSHAHKNIVKFFINEKRLDVNDRGKDNWTPLHHGVKKDSESFVDFLIEKGADIYAEDYNGKTPLELAENKKVKPKLLGKALIDAVKENNIEKVRKYIKEGVNVNHWYEDSKWTALHYAASLGYQRLAVELAKNNKVSIETKDFEDSNPLHIAAAHGNKNIVEFFLNFPNFSKGSNKELIESKGKDYWTPLHYAAYGNQLSVVKFLIEQGANIDAKGLSEETPLQLALEKGDSHKEIAKLLRSRELFNILEHIDDEPNKIKDFFNDEIDVNYSNSSNLTPLHNAVLNGHSKITEFLVEKGANVNIRNNNREKPLHIAAKLGNKDIVEFFIDKSGVNVNDQGKDKWTALHYAAADSHLDVVKYLVEEKEASIYVKNSKGETPLELAKDGAVKSILLGKALIDAVKQNNIEKVKEYIGQGANVNYWYEDSKWTALHYAASLGHQRSAEELIKNSLINISAKNSDSNEPLHIAAANGHKNVVELILKNEKGLLSINHSGQMSYTALHYAAEGGHLEVVELLIEKEADSNLKNSDGKTPLQLARDKGHKAVIQFLLNKGLFNAVKVIGAVKEGDRDKVTEYINDGVNINHLDHDGWSLLHHAANREVDDLEFIRFLVEKGANVSTIAHSRDKPIHIASKKAYKDIVEFFLNEKGSEVNDRGKDNRTPLHHGVEKDSESFVDFLIEKGADIYAEDYNSKTPLELAENKKVKAKLLGKALIDAVKENNIEKVRKYIKEGVNVNHWYEDSKWTALHYAASLGYQRLALELINKNKIVVNAKSSDGSSPLHIAAANGKVNIVTLLLEKEANINEVGQNNWTPLHYATYGNQLSVVKFLIEKGANIEAKGLNEETPLQLAIEKGDSHKEIAKLLRSRALFNILEHIDDEPNKIKDFFNDEIDVNYSNSSNLTPLHNAVLNGHSKITEFLVEKGANVNIRNNNREKPLHIAAKLGHKDIVEFFIDKSGLSVNDQGKDKWTALHYAAAGNHFDVVKYLVEEKGADIDQQDKDSYSPLHHAAKEGNIKIVRFLVEKGANINSQNSQGKVPGDLSSEPEVIQFLLDEGLFNAVRENKAKEVKDYLDKEVRGKKANVNYKDQNNLTPLHHAALHGYFSIVNDLVQKGADVNIGDLNNWRPLHYASRDGHLNVVKFLTENNAEINAKNSEGNKPLHIAAKNGQQAIVKFFVSDKGMDVNSKGENNWTPLHYASNEGHVKIVQFLVDEADANITVQNAQGKVPLELASVNPEIVRTLQNRALFDDVEKGEYAKVQKHLDDGADPNSLDVDNWTLLHHAAKKGYLSIVLLLIEKGANIDAKNLDGNKPLHIASEYGHMSIIKLLLNGRVNDTGKNNKTPLHYAAGGSHFEVVQYLVEEGADINLKDDYERKAIHIAAKSGSRAIVKLFLDKKLSVNDLGKDGWTALHYAAEQDKLEVVELLIERGADINARNSDGKTPLELTKNQKIKELLINKALFNAVKKGDFSGIQDSLSSGASVDSTNKWGWGTLHAAAARDNLPLIRSLVEEKGANINARNKDGEKPLHIATEKGSLEILQYFLSRENNIDDVGKNNWTPLHYAAKYNYPKIVEFLIKEGAKVDAIDHDNKTPLQLTTEEHIKVLLRNEALSRAVKLGNDSEVISYINDGANVNYSDKSNYTLLHDASSKGYINIVRTLIDNGADIRARDFNGNKALHTAADYGHKSIVELFLEKGLSVNDKGKNNWTPLHYAASRGGLALVELLVKKRADINAQDFSRNKVIHVAAENGQRSIIEFFLNQYEGESNINDKGNNDWTMLHYAADKGYSEVVKFLIEKGADIDAKDADNRTPLQLASGKNHQEEARLLRNKALSNAVKQGDISKVKLYLADGADPNYKDENNWTALHDAASKGYAEIVRLLKEIKANVDARSYEAKPLHYAARNGHKNVLELLIDESNVNDRGKNNWTPLHYASRHGRSEVIEFLLQKKADINLRDTDKNKPLHIAAKYGYANVVELLLKEDGIGIDDKGGSGKTALHYGAENGRASVVEFLIDNGANINIQDSEENTPLQLAIDSEVIKLLLDKVLFDAVKQGNIDKVKEHISTRGVNVTNKRGWGLLHLAAADGNLSMIRFLVDSKGADINIKNNSNEKPLHIAAKNGQVDVVEFFIKQGVNVNSLGKSNWTPLHYASEGDYIELARLLIREGATLNIRNSDDKTPLQLAEEKNHLEIVELLLNEELLYAVKQNDIQRVKKNLSKGANVNYSDQIIGWTLLHYAARANLLKLTKILVGEGADVNLGPYSTRPLHIASQYGHKDMVDFLLYKGSDINDPGWNSWTPLHYAAEKGHLDVVRLLVEKEADINAQDFNGKTPLELATENGHTEVVKVLSNAGLFYAIGRKDLRKVEHYFHIGANVNARDNNGFIPLHKAALAGDLEVIRFLLNKNAVNVDARNNKKGIGTLHEAAKGGNLKIVKLLISYGASIYDQDANGAKPIHIAAEYGHRDIVEFFLNNNLSISSRDKMGKSILHYAAKSGNLETIELLINRGANINAKDSNDLEPLHIATQHGKQNIVEYFIVEKQSNINERDKNHRTLMHYAAESGNLNLIKFLVDQGLDVNTVDINNINPLHIAAELGHENVVKFFLSSGVSINYPDEDNKIPLHYAAMGGNIEVIKLLVKKGANVNAKDNSGAKPLHVAAQYGHKNIVEFFIVQKQLNVNDQGQDNWTPIHYAVKGQDDLTHKYFDENKLLQVIKFLLRQDISLINAKDFYGVTPLHIASRYGHENLVEFFIQRGSNVNDVDNHKLTPLHYSAQHGHLKVTKFLVEEGGNIMATNIHGKKPIHSAAKNIHKNVVLFFIEKGLSINDPDTHRRWTPLHYATDSGNLDFVQTLLAEGADFKAIDVHSAKPLHIAAENGYSNIVNLFLDKGLSVNDMGKDNWTPLFYASSKGRLNTIKLLIERRKANIKSKDSRGNEAIHIAAENGYKDVVKFLLDKGSNVNDVGGSDWRPLHYAASQGHLDIVKFLVEEMGASINSLTINNEKPIDVAISTKHEKVAEYLAQRSERHIRHQHSRARYKRAVIDQQQSSQTSGASKQSSLISNSIAWIKNWISELLVQPIVSNKQSLYDFPPLSNEDQNTQSNYQTMYQTQEKIIYSEDMMLYYVLYSWFNGSKCKIKPQTYVNDILLERDAIVCALRVEEKFELVVKRAANSSGISYGSIKIDFLEMQKTITAKIMRGDYDTISEYLDLCIKNACPKNLTQKQISDFKMAYDTEKTLSNQSHVCTQIQSGLRDISCKSYTFKDKANKVNKANLFNTTNATQASTLCTEVTKEEHGFSRK